MLRSIKTNEPKPEGPFRNAGDYRDMTTMEMLNLPLDPGMGVGRGRKGKKKLLR